ncbi:MAG: peptidoglycan -binding protein [Pseudomonadota bacterium]
MALARRTGQRLSANVWPGFVDAMTALLLVLMFVLSIFMIVQFILSEALSDRERELVDLNEQVTGLARALGLEQQRAATLEDDIATLTTERESQAVLIATLTQQRDELNTRVASFEEQVASLIADRDRLTGDLASSEGARNELSAELQTTAEELTRIIDEREALQLALASAREEIDSQAEAARLAAARADAVEALVAELQAEAESRDATLAQTLAALENQEAQAASLATQLDTLNTELDAAEAARLAELAAAEALRARLADQEANLTQQEQDRLAEAAAAEALRARLEAADTELTAMSLALEEQRREAEETLTLLAATQTTRDDLNARLAQALTDLQGAQGRVSELDAALAARSEDAQSDAELQDALAAALAAQLAAEGKTAEALTRAEQTNLLLAQAQTELANVEDDRVVAQREAALLNQQILELRSQLGSLQNLLDQSAERDADAQVQIDALGNRLNAALAQVAASERAERERLEAEAQNLERFRSEFFGQLREVLAGRDGVEVVGDRFVFSSEVLFDVGDVTLQSEGRQQIAQVAAVILDVADQIPEEIDWILRVDGHTDNVPLLGSGKYANNWELSQGRALSVVQYMINDLGVPPFRLAATGFGEYRPVDPADTPTSRQRNRRIELKLTER